MPTLTCDGRSFMLDGRRIWLVSGSIPYARIPQEYWHDRIHAAKLAGLNCIDAPVVWSRHEPRPGRFDFNGDNDIRRFIQLVHKAGMYCVLRMGPFVGYNYDMGGMPPWLLQIKDMKLRTNNAPFLEACSRYFGALADQIRDLQVSAPGEGGPIILMQLESGWTCAHDGFAESYLGELQRYLRESGLELQTFNDHNLWQSAEGQLDGWRGSDNMLATLRQLSVVRPDQPRLVTDFAVGEPSYFGEEAPEPMTATQAMRKLAEVLAGGGQVNLQPFAAGSNTGYLGGRDATNGGFVSSISCATAPLTESGAVGPLYHPLRRLTTFASRFARVFAHLEPSYQPVIADPSFSGGTGKTKKGASKSGGCKVVHITGSQGGFVFVFGDEDAESGEAGARTTSLLLSDGSTLPVNLGSQPVAWLLLDVSVGGRSRVDYTNLSCMGTQGKMLVLFGPKGSSGVISVNGSPMDVEVPSAAAKAPLVLDHEGLTIIIASEEQVDGMFFADDAVYFGVLGILADGKPVGAAGVKTCLKVNLEGEVKQVPVSHAVESKPHGISLAHWSSCGVAEYAAGESARFAKIDGPQTLTQLGSLSGYGWYRIDLPGHATHKARVVAPRAADRLHIFVDGVESGVLGFGPGATFDGHIQLRKGGQRLVVLAEAFGRLSGGPTNFDDKGLASHIYETDSIKGSKPKVLQGDPIDILAFKSPLWEVREGDCTSPFRLSWPITRKNKKSDVLIHLQGLTQRAILVINDKPSFVLEPIGTPTIVLDAETLGKNSTIQLALIPTPTSAFDSAEEVEALIPDLCQQILFEELIENLTEKAQWSFAKWEPPSATDFHNAKNGKAKEPTWWKTTFKAPVSQAAAHLELDGMTKGQMFINGRHLGRYFVATADGKTVPPQESYYIPASWMRLGEENEVMLFDEHGGFPGKARITFDGHSHPITAAIS